MMPVPASAWTFALGFYFAIVLIHGARWFGLYTTWGATPWMP